MRVEAVLEVLDALRGAGCRAWLGGGWGVDALVGRQTREHRDVDLALDAGHEGSALTALGGLGYVVETDWRPVRVELAAPGRRWVDVHPVRFDTTGHGVQAGPDGTAFAYPRGCLTTGVLDGVAVPCLSAAQQVAFHTGYPPREVDLADLALLRPMVEGSAGA